MSVEIHGWRSLAAEFDFEVDLGQIRGLTAVNTAMDVANVAVWFLCFHQTVRTAIHRMRTNPSLCRVSVCRHSELMTRLWTPYQQRAAAYFLPRLAEHFSILTQISEAQRKVDETVYV